MARRRDRGDGLLRWRDGLFRSGLDSGRGRLLQLCRRRFSPGGGGSFCSAADGSVFREGEAYLAPSSSYTLRRVEATTALRCRLETRYCRKEKLVEVVVTNFNLERRVGGPDESASDDAFDGGPPDLKAVGASDKSVEGVLAVFREVDGQDEAVCDACGSKGVDANVWHAASLLDACIPADVGRVDVFGPRARLKFFRV
ncbi:LOW QUALITY PROTEIN: hypothetical protein HID58_076262 [Brassica napus]|uniref:Uncharacterized protein n=1 Tax=Brassica napus TaxID=3708 RepID=A0ABQ7YM01_BRANA|nr:LOW QUALITY PROTEIN: hypothetical protein HID58_076262 [Brassica napus]